MINFVSNLKISRLCGLFVFSKLIMESPPLLMGFCFILLVLERIYCRVFLMIHWLILQCCCVVGALLLCILCISQPWIGLTLSVPFLFILVSFLFIMMLLLFFIRTLIILCLIGKLFSTWPKSLEFISYLYNILVYLYL